MAIAVRTRARAPARPGHRLLRFDRALDSPYVAGADEAGRGALAGPLVTAAVLFDHRRLVGRACAPLALLDDSKRHTHASREELYRAVCEAAERICVRVFPASVIDQRGVHHANLRGLASALEGIAAPDGAVLLSDGFRLPLARVHRAVIGGDGRSAAIAAASIIAKVTRDRLMQRAHASFPRYGFSEHVGYGTPQHRLALDLHGPCDLHRRSFSPISLRVG